MDVSKLLAAGVKMRPVHRGVGRVVEKMAAGKKKPRERLYFKKPG
jgi:hypothetical protein